ncbi:hypothetical protein CEUSTIGMA_g4095.t1 [Chlamydomonas eustigma]|uniref:Uncharacterized protein n=1 Tax=Chlamydomonas eustigma TaxID=1157962 RepID=A0A250X141_9CHLO|nr:hypothetical protein CEUSTIGMA_g4095.t1 [Chlamydomonas eustigma]|eukprot:GAX76649.1 hypothetical protein CEUSTIGMA_g4095.t1 [Chlamydomonas eustigma]
MFRCTPDVAVADQPPQAGLPSTPTLDLSAPWTSPPDSRPWPLSAHTHPASSESEDAGIACTQEEAVCAEDNAMVMNHTHESAWELYQQTFAAKPSMLVRPPQGIPNPILSADYSGGPADNHLLDECTVYKERTETGHEGDLEYYGMPLPAFLHFKQEFIGKVKTADFSRLSAATVECMMFKLAQLFGMTGSVLSKLSPAICKQRVSAFIDKIEPKGERTTLKTYWPKMREMVADLVNNEEEYKQFVTPEEAKAYKSNANSLMTAQNYLHFMDRLYRRTVRRMDRRGVDFEEEMWDEGTGRIVMSFELWDTWRSAAGFLSKLQFWLLTGGDTPRELALTNALVNAQQEATRAGSNNTKLGLKSDLHVIEKPYTAEDWKRFVSEWIHAKDPLEAFKMFRLAAMMTIAKKGYVRGGQCPKYAVHWYQHVHI